MPAFHLSLPQTNGVSKDNLPDPEVTPRAERRNFARDYKLRILNEADRCKAQGEIGALLRREGLYSSHLAAWRRQREAGELALKSRGKPPGDPLLKQLAQLQKENERLKERLDRAETIIEVQKKVSLLLGLTSEAGHKGDGR